jgi:hypothetical protein
MPTPMEKFLKAMRGLEKTRNPYQPEYRVTPENVTPNNEPLSAEEKALNTEQ